MFMSEQSIKLTTLFLCRLIRPKLLTSTKCTCFCQSLTTALLESVEGEEIISVKVSGWMGPLALESDTLQNVRYIRAPDPVAVTK